MTAQQEELIENLEKAIDEIEKVKQGLAPTFDAGLQALANSWLAPPQPAMNWLHGRANDAVTRFNNEATNAQNYCNDCINNTRHCFTLRSAERAYRSVDFSTVEAKTKVDEIAGDAATAWVSGNRDEYVIRLGEMESRVRGLKTSLEELAESFAQMAEAVEQRDVDLAIALGSLVLAIAGIVIAISTGVTGWGAIAGLVITVIGAVGAAISLYRVFTVVPGRRDEMINELSNNTTTIRNDDWPAGPRLVDSDW